MKKYLKLLSALVVFNFFVIYFGFQRFVVPEKEKAVGLHIYNSSIDNIHLRNNLIMHLKTNNVETVNKLLLRQQFWDLETVYFLNEKLRIQQNQTTNSLFQFVTKEMIDIVNEDMETMIDPIRDRAEKFLIVVRDERISPGN